MGNFNGPDKRLIDHLNQFRIKILTKEEHRQLELLKFDSLQNNHIKLHTVYKYQKIGYDIRSDFILCQSSSSNIPYSNVQDIIKNVKLGKECIAYLQWDYKEKRKMLIGNLLKNHHVSCYKIDLIEMRPRESFVHYCKVRQSYFSENDHIDAIIANFISYPIQKKLILSQIINHNDIQGYIFKIYVKMLYV